MAGARRRKPLTVLVLAAGQGTRMRSKHGKLLHPVAGRPMAVWALDAAAALRPSRVITVVGYQADQVREALVDTGSEFVLQREQRGTGHAVREGIKALGRGATGTVLIINGDLPTLRRETLRRLLRRHRDRGAALTLLTANVDDPTGYGRVVRDGSSPRRIVEHRDADATTRAIPEINVGIYCAELADLAPALKRLRPNNAQGEYYLTDAVHDLIDRGKTVVAIVHDGAAEEILGVNNRADLARASATLYARKAEALMTAGVTILAPERTWIDPRARVGRDTTIHPDVHVEGRSVIGEDCIVRPGCRIVDSRIGDGVEIKDHTVMHESRIGDGGEIGPFAHLRPGTRLDRRVRLGNFVETKKARLRDGTKAPHLTYLGDTDVGAGSNIGAGTITCNYDGASKHPTVLGRGVFVGSDSQLIAPVKIGDGAYIAAGSTITQDVPRGALAIARGRQRNVEGWTERRKARKAGAAAPVGAGKRRRKG